MKVFSLLAVFGFIFFFISCEENKDANVSNEIADFEVSGMVCQMGCGGAIRKELYASGFVDQVDVNFEEDLPSNLISVHFNSDKITVEKIEEIIETINDGQFKVDFKRTIKKSDESTSAATSSPSNATNHSFRVEENSFSFPNLTELFKSLVR
jgi:hypothetical protein